MAAHERERVAAARIGDRHAGVARHGDARGNARHDLEAHALLVEEQRFGAAAIEDERVAPLQPRDDFSFARLLGEEIADGFLLERLRRRDADVDLFRIGARGAQEARRHEMVVQHDVRRLEALQAANGDEHRIARSRAD